MRGSREGVHGIVGMSIFDANDALKQANAEAKLPEAERRLRAI